MRPKLLIVTTLPDTFIGILKDQPKFLNRFFNTALATSPNSNLQKLIEQEGLPVFSIPMRRGISPIFDLYSIMKCVWILIQYKPHIVHSYTPKAGLVSMIASLICRVPVRIHTFTGLIFPTQVGMKKKILIFVDRLICFCATTVVPEGQGVLSDLKEYKITSKELKIIGFGNIAGVDTKYFSPFLPNIQSSGANLRRELGLIGFVFCYVGRLHRDKGIKELVLAFLKINNDATLLIVGPDDDEGPVEPEILKLIDSSTNIHRLGHMEDIRPALAASDLLVLASYREGFPNVLLQAGAMTLPVIATSISGSNEIVKNEWNGWLIPVRSVSALSAAMMTAMNTPKNCLKVMGERSRESIKLRFERKNHLDRMKYFYNELI